MYSVYTLLKVVCYFDLSVLSMSVMGFQKKFGWGWVGGVSSIQVVFFWNFFNFAMPLRTMRQFRYFGNLLTQTVEVERDGGCD